MSPQSQQIPESPTAAIQIMRRELERLETQPWVRNFNSPGSMSTATQSVGQQTAETLQSIGLGYTTLVSFAVQTISGTKA